MTKIKLFFDATPLIDNHVSGVGKVLQETLKSLDTIEYTERYQIYLFLPFNEISKAKRLKYKYIQLKLLPYPHKFLSLFARMRFSPPIDVFLGKGVYVFENFRNWNLLLSKSITYIHDVSFQIYPEFVEERNLAYLQRHVGMWMKRTDKIVTVSEASRDELMSEFSLDDVAVVANAVDTSVFYRRSSAEIVGAGNKWGLPKNYLLFIGNIEPRKNLISTLRAFRRYIDETGSDDALVIVGGGGWRNEEIINEIEAVRSKGVVVIRPDGYVPDEDLPALISGARALLQFSWHEGFGLPVLQAIACGTPVAASDIPSLHEAAGSNEKWVSYAPADNVRKLAESIKRSVEISHRDVHHDSVRTWDAAVHDLLAIVDEVR